MPAVRFRAIRYPPRPSKADLSLQTERLKLATQVQSFAAKQKRSSKKIAKRPAAKLSGRVRRRTPFSLSRSHGVRVLRSGAQHLQLAVPKIHVNVVCRKATSSDQMQLDACYGSLVCTGRNVSALMYSFYVLACFAA